MIRDALKIERAFEHLLDLLHEEDADSETIAAVESAKEIFEEEAGTYVNAEDL